MGGGGEEWVAVGGLDCCDEMRDDGWLMGQKREMCSYDYLAGSNGC